MEELALLAVAAVLIVVAVSLLAPKLGVAAPILLVVVGIGCSLIPGVPEILIEPEWILTIVLPPILYAAAINVPVTDFRRDFGTITALSVFLVIGSALGAAVVIWWLLPDINLATAIALGAVVSPPDAVAATSIGKRLGLPPRLVTILEGEGLVNDATALVLLRTAVAATAGSVSLWGVAGDFAKAVIIGVAVGAAVGIVTVWIRSKIRQQPVHTTAISLTVPFLAFMPAEQLHASGVISVVVAGLITGHQAPRRFTAQDRVTERTNWRTIQLLLENGVFLLMGFEMTAIIDDVHASGDGVGRALLIAAAVTATLIAIRILLVVPLIAMLRHRQRRAADYADWYDNEWDAAPSDDSPINPRRASAMDRRRADARFLTTQGLGWRGGAVIAWSGMRGVITLAAAQSLPHDVPHRAELILIAFIVALATLIGQGGTLPALIRFLGIKGTDADFQRREAARLASEIMAARKATLDSPTLRREDGRPFDPEIIERSRARALAFHEALTTMSHDDLDTPARQVHELRRVLVEAEQAVLLDARASGTYDSHTLERAQSFIDAEETRLAP